MDGYNVFSHKKEGSVQQCTKAVRVAVSPAWPTCTAQCHAFGMREVDMLVRSASLVRLA
eukprot:CAMPEP_0183351846 /NCGR_PEP_ID=MMETSP0164_2-20130417/26293_1 /TAXON_ID=221442 /ORGANISM="Coccolithus pelagicus ssp braarudi, Strain PLY182g" /LENGTH=58 /DNA_ID=CAMNT_0025524137 /DNA_START=278 /DNA_END=454 /DNA_ORIENTATION=-